MCGLPTSLRLPRHLRPLPWLYALGAATTLLTPCAATAASVENPRASDSPPVVFVLPAPTQPTTTAADPSSPPAAEPAQEISTPATPQTPAFDDLWMKAQIALSRRGFSCGPIDGVHGAQTSAALFAFQQTSDLPKTGGLNSETRARLFPPAEDLLAPLILSEDDLAGLQPVDPTWLGKSRQSALAYETVLERIAERTHSSPTLLQRLNPDVHWDALQPGTAVIVPLITPPAAAVVKAAQIHIRLAERVLQVRDADDKLIAHFPVSIARDVEKRTEGEFHVVVVIADPDYTFNPAIFPESEEARTLGRKLVLPPGPNNPVGVAWIGLDREGYGIHGTPHPEKVGRTESHGCFRLANWDARALLAMSWTGLPVIVEP
jgi:lipoprotein-anchoring transpeptidase ErfK/SrfK